MPTTLYHYSNQPLKEIITLEEQSLRKLKKLSPAKISQNLTYQRFHFEQFPRHQELSFMIDQLPLEIIAKANWSKDHPIYQSKKVIYCHYINVEKLPSMPWRLIESPLDTFLANYLWFDNNLYKRIYFRVKVLLKRWQGYQSQDHQRLIKVVKEFKGLYPKYFLKWLNSKYFPEQNSMYAASVPHIQLYPGSYSIKPYKITKIIFK